MHHEEGRYAESRLPRDNAEDGFAFEDDAFLDRVSNLLSVIAHNYGGPPKPVTTSGNSSHGSDPVEIAKAADVLADLQRLCREAGIVQVEPTSATPSADSYSPSPSPARSNVAGSRVAPFPRPSPAKDQRSTWPAIDFAVSRDDTEDRGRVMDRPREQGAPSSGTPPHAREASDDIIEVEITDILVSTQEEIQRWKHEFRLEMMEHEARQHELNREHLEQIQSLRAALEDSQRHVGKLQREIQETNTRLQAMQALANKSQRAMELTLTEHTQYWKSICNDLVVEKRNIAKRLAEERGKYHALREHIGMHEEASPPRTSASRSPNRASSPPRSRSLSSKAPAERYPETPTLATTHVSSRARDGGAYTARGEDESSSSSFQPSTSTFRRYYLTKKPSTKSQ